METQAELIAKQEYLEYLSQVFPQLANDVEYEWAFCRPFAGMTPDIFVFRDENGEIAAGSSVTYRHLENPVSKETLTVGIMTGSWTLPKFRGKGYFSRIIQHSLQLVKQRGGDALTAFVTGTNASARRLLAAGSRGVPAFYVFSNPDSVSSTLPLSGITREVPATEAILRELHSIQQNENTGNEFHFAYNFAEFRLQFFERPQSPVILRVQKKLVLVEESSDAVKILLLPRNALSETVQILEEVSAWAACERKKKTYYYTLSAEESEVLATRGFKTVPGWFTVLPVTGCTLSQNLERFSAAIQLGDKM